MGYWFHKRNRTSNCCNFCAPWYCMHRQKYTQKLVNMCINDERYIKKVLQSCASAESYEKRVNWDVKKW